jgi:hypothetical protein
VSQALGMRGDVAGVPGGRRPSWRSGAAEYSLVHQAQDPGVTRRWRSISGIARLIRPDLLFRMGNLPQCELRIVVLRTLTRALR